MKVMAFGFGAKGESAWARKYRLHNFLEFLGPGGIATADDATQTVRGRGRAGGALRVLQARVTVGSCGSRASSARNAGRRRKWPQASSPATKA